MRRNLRALIPGLTVALALGSLGRTATLAIGAHHIILVNGTPAFSIEFMWAPPPGYELNPGAPLYPALIAADAGSTGKVFGCGRYRLSGSGSRRLSPLLASKRQVAAINVRFSGLPAALLEGEVLYEAPRTVAVSGCQFSDGFAPRDVHVYRFKMTA